ncbi:MAG TPA: hypothetical protein VFH51_08130 [Myxococcota bacterium]|nr:hypothetical protein [Myxococcota bacterium]
MDQIRKLGNIHRPVLHLKVLEQSNGLLGDTQPDLVGRPLEVGRRFIRSVITGVNMMSRSDALNRAFDAFEAAVDWVGQVLGQDALIRQNAAELVTALRAL